MRKFVVISLSVLFFLGLLLVGAGFYMLDISLKPEGGQRDIEASYRYMFGEYPGLETWVDSLKQAEALRDTFITADDGARLHALYVRAAMPTDKTAVLVHGYTDNAVRMLMIGQLYSRDLGYNILLPDLRNSGLSDGDHYNMGWLDRFDVVRWLNVAHQLYGGRTQMVVHGISMGGATTMMVSGEPMPDYVKCFVEDCGYTAVSDEFTHKLKSDYGLPPFPLIPVTGALCKLKYGWSFDEASALRQVERCTLPMLFIHSDADTYVPTAMVYPLYKAKPGEKELWITAGSPHAMSYRDHKEDYTRRVRDFVSKYMKSE